jgi:hypothetical protein
MVPATKCDFPPVSQALTEQYFAKMEMRKPSLHLRYLIYPGLQMVYSFGQPHTKCELDGSNYLVRETDPLEGQLIDLYRDSLKQLFRVDCSPRITPYPSTRFCTPFFWGGNVPSSSQRSSTSTHCASDMRHT